MAYTTINKLTEHFNTKLYTGNGSTNAITGVGFAPDFVWIKERSSTSSHVLSTTIQGTGKRLSSNTTDVEASLSNIFTSFDSDGFTHGADNGVNESSQTYASWNWLAGGTASSNTDGSITSSVSANTTAGFSIISYAGNDTADSTIGHGLGVKPNFIIFKARTWAGRWHTYHSVLGATGHMRLDSDTTFNTTSSFMNDTEPTSSVINLGTSAHVNALGNNHIAYCFAEKKGFSKFGSYTGNGSSDGTFVYTGFKPAFVIIKRSSGIESWYTFDNKRDTSNAVSKGLVPNQNIAEFDADALDFTSNGFKIRTSAVNYNTSGDTYIYMAFGQSLVGSNNVPCTAR